MSRLPVWLLVLVPRVRSWFRPREVRLPPDVRFVLPIVNVPDEMEIIKRRIATAFEVPPELMEGGTRVWPGRGERRNDDD